MGSERASTIRQRESGQICCECSNFIHEERSCRRCRLKAQARIYDADGDHRYKVHLQFFLHGRVGWVCNWLVKGQPIAKATSYKLFDKVREIAKRGGGLPDLAAKQALEQAEQAGRGGVDLLLTAEQYSKLR